MIQVHPVCPGFFMVSGRMPADPLRRPESANAFIFEGQDWACLIDSGMGEPVRSALLGFFSGKSFDTFTLVNSRWCEDRVSNNDIVNHVRATARYHVIRFGDALRFFNTRRFLAPLQDQDRIEGHRLQVWPVGGLVIIDDHGCSLDSVTVFDPLRGVLLLGDLTCEFTGPGAQRDSAAAGRTACVPSALPAGNWANYG